MPPASPATPIAVGDRAAVTAICGMLALASALGIGRFVYTPILPTMAAALGLSKSTAGLLASASFAGYLLGAVAAAASRLPGGRRIWFVGGLATAVATTIAMGLSSGLPTFLVLRFLGGGAGAFVIVLSTASVLDALASAGRPQLSAVHYGGVGLGIAVSAMLVAALEAQGANWRVLWVASGVIAAAMATAPAFLLRWRPPPGATCGRAAPLGKGLLSLTVCHTLFGFGYVVTATFLIAIVRGSPSGRTVEPLIWTVAGLAAMPSMLLWNWVAARFGARPAYAAASIMEAAGVLLAGGRPDGAGLLLAAALFGGTFMGITALGFGVARQFGPEGQERRFAVITTGFGLGQAIGPLLGGAIADVTGDFWIASALAAGALGLSAILIVTSGRNSKVSAR